MLHPAVEAGFLLESCLFQPNQAKGDNHMKNRIIALALCAGMLLLGGCASHDEAAGSPPESSVGSTLSSVETEAPPEAASQRTEPVR